MAEKSLHSLNESGMREEELKLFFLFAIQEEEEILAETIGSFLLGGNGPTVFLQVLALDEIIVKDETTLFLIDNEDNSAIKHNSIIFGSVIGVIVVWYAQMYD